MTLFVPYRTLSGGTLLRMRPGTALAAIILGGIVLAALLAPLIAPQNPFDLASLDVLDAELPPRWLAGGDPRFLLGTDSQGRDLLSAILYGTPVSCTAAGRGARPPAATGACVPWACSPSPCKLPSASPSASSPATSGAGWTASLPGLPTCSSRSRPSSSPSLHSPWCALASAARRLAASPCHCSSW